ncbi:MAG: alpha-1,3-galactosidase, partial [Paraprevotella sp.]|nr:alpha-1,3-galactosidase [Paraprevotella sp.]
TRTPTRGGLVTTLRKVLIADNVFYRLPMSGILISDDARSWYESGPVRDVTILHNSFIECGSPAIAVSPENDRYEGAVHRNITVEANRFLIRQGEAVHACSTDGLTIEGNYISTPRGDVLQPESFFKAENCRQVTIRENRCGSCLPQL